MLMILAGAIFACLLGIIYLLWNQRTVLKLIDNLENQIALVQSSRTSTNHPSQMPSLEEVIAHYEQQLGPDTEDETDADIAITGDESDASAEPDSNPQSVAIAMPIIDESDETEGDAEEITETKTKVIEFGLGGVTASYDDDVDMSKFSAILSKELKELCKKLGFSPKGNKKDIISRLLKHPKYSTEEDLVQEFKKVEETADTTDATDDAADEVGSGAGGDDDESNTISVDLE